MYEGEIPPGIFLPSMLFSGAAAAAEVLAPPIIQHCCRCEAILGPREVFCGTELCNDCYDLCPKHCRMCGGNIPWKQLRYASGLCGTCHHFSKKECRVCDKMIMNEDLNWRVNMCHKCYSECPKQCATCSTPFAEDRLWWNSNLCENCWEHDDHCKACECILDHNEKHWDSNLCNACYNQMPKACSKCNQPVAISDLFWQTGLCNSCYDESEVCKQCKNPLRNRRQQKIWETNLCDACYKGKRCRSCGSKLGVKHLKWETELCDVCWEKQAAPQQAPTSKSPYSGGVAVVIASQFVFYMVQEMIRPLIYLHILGVDSYGEAPKAYAFVMALSSTIGTLAPMCAGVLAEQCGPRAVYSSVCIGGVLANLLFLNEPPLTVFALCWAGLTMPASAVRGIRAAFFAKHVDQIHLVKVGNHASNAGILGGFSGPLLAAALSYTDFPFQIAAVICGLVMGVTALLIIVFLPAEQRKERVTTTAANGSTILAPCSKSIRCTQCLAESTSSEKGLCERCYDHFGGAGTNFWWYSTYIMILCWAFVVFLEISLNAGVVVSFQPVVVEHFKWRNSSIALVNTAGALLGFCVLTLLIQWNPRETVQATVAAACYLFAVMCFMLPPLAQWRLIAGVMVAAAAQLMLYPALEAMFAHKLGKLRVTNRRAVVFSLAGPVGTALGTAMAPLCVAHAGTFQAMLIAAPALLAMLGVCWMGYWKRRQQRLPLHSLKSPLLSEA